MKDLWDKAKAYVEKGDAFLEKGHNKRALNSFLKALEIQKNFLLEEGSDSHLELVYTYFNLGKVYCALNELDKALEFAFKVLQNQEGNFAQNYKYLPISTKNIADIYFEKTDFFKSLEFYLKSLSYLRCGMRLYKEDEKEYIQMRIAVDCDKIGVLYFDLQDFPNALKYSLKALKFYRKILGDSSTDLFAKYDYLLNIYNKLDEDEKALKFALRYFKILKACPEERDELIYLSNYIATLYANLNDPQKALKYYFEGLKTLENISELNTKRSAIIYNNISAVYLNGLKDYENAVIYIKKALAVEIKVFGESSIDVGSTYFYLATTCTLKKDYGEALKYCFKSLFIFEAQVTSLPETSFDECHDKYFSSLTLLGDIYRYMGKNKEADALPELLEEEQYR